MLLLLAVWAATHVRFTSGGGQAAAEDRQAARRAAIEQAKRNAPRTIDYRRLDSRLQALMADNAMVGLAVGIVENGEITFLKGYGETVAGSGDLVTSDTVFRWASVSKGVAGDMVAKLAEEGKLSLSDPIAKYSASLRLPGGMEHRATVADVLAHTLGIFAHAHDSKLEDGMDPRLLRGELAALNLICPPGQCHSYQNVAYDAASDVVERVTGKPYQQAVVEQLFRPLGMNSATLTREGLMSAPSWARPHRGGKNSKPVEVTQPYYSVPAAGGVNSSIKDLAVWMQAQMGLDPMILSPKVLATVQAPRVKTPSELRRMRNFRERLASSSYGLGWRSYDYAGHTIVGHRGGVTGYRSLIMFDPARKSGVVALWNASTNKPSGLEFEVMDMILQLPPRDWMKLDGNAPAPEPVSEKEEDAPVTDVGP
ncbi:MAG TPA: serine hydrolase domain-containing protein [Allosphingosinicella sp.]|nr:serine hydrolase domain-containing protein [Allosphingosinicella sp.]